MKPLAPPAFLALLVGLIACDLPRPTASGSPDFDGTAYRPVYASADDLLRIETLAPQPLRKPGKIYVKGNYLFVNESGEGLHIIDNRDPAHPQKMAFLKIPGNHDLAVRGNYLYADNALDLVVVDLTDPLDAKLVKRVEGAIPAQNYPPHQNIYFECVEPERGIVIDWEKVSVASPPACFR